MAQSSTAILNWNANTESDLAGYRVYAGLQPGLPVVIVTVGLVTTYTFFTSFFTSDGRWWFAVSAVDTTNNEGALSPVVTEYQVRVATRLAIRH